MSEGLFACVYCLEETEDELTRDECCCQCWDWREAFEKRGFDDGGNLFNGTDLVADVIRAAGFTVECGQSMHNYMIYAIKKGDFELYPECTNRFKRQARPNEYLPSEVLEPILEAVEKGILMKINPI